MYVQHNRTSFDLILDRKRHSHAKNEFQCVNYTELNNLKPDRTSKNRKHHIASVTCGRIPGHFKTELQLFKLNKISSILTSDFRPSSRTFQPARLLKQKIILFTLSTHYILLPSILQVPDF